MSRGGLWQFKDGLFHALCLTAALSVPFLSLILLVFLIAYAMPSCREYGFSFFVHSNWNTNKLDFGALSFIYGTITTSLLAMVMAVPVSVLAAAFLAEIAPGWLRRGATFLIELLAAIPSVVYGFWGVFFVVPILQTLYFVVDAPNTTGRGIFSASVILAIMIVPYIAAISFDVCRAVPSSQREGALALGSTRWQMIWRVVLPFARPGILGACFLALGRALGETMAVAMLIGNNTKLDLGIFALGSTIPSVIANELATASRDLHKSALVELGVVLFLVTVLVNCLARVLIWRVESRNTSNSFLSRFWNKCFASKTPSTKVLPSGVASKRAKGISTEYQRNMSRTMDVVMTWVMGVSLAMILFPLFHIFGYVTWRGLGSVDLAFFTNLPNDNTPGLGHSLLGTAILVGLATVAAVPIGILAGIYLTEYRSSRLTPIVRFIGELLGGVPSIVVGIFAYALLVAPFGFSAWAGAFALAVLMIPFVMRTSEESLKLVPPSLRNASLALGASRSQTLVRVLLPSALPAVITGVFLAIARIAGETAPLLFTAYNSNYWPKSLNDRMPFLTYYIYNYSLSDVLDEQRQAWAGALILLALIMVLNVGIRSLTGKRVLLASRSE